MEKPLLRILVVTLAIVTLASSSMVFAQVVVTDSIGQTVTLAERPSRIVVLSPSITEFLAYIGELDRVVGADSQSMSIVWFMNASALLRERGVVDVGGYWWSAVNVEKILELKPDLVLADKGAHLPLRKIFEDYNLTVIYLNGGSSSSINDVLSDMNIIATVFGKNNYVDKFADEVQSAFLIAQRELMSSTPRKVLVVVGVYNGIWVAGRGTFIDDVLSRLGLENAARTYSWSAVNIEKILEWSPDIVLVTPMGIDEKVLKESGLNMLEGRIHLLNETEADIMLRPGPLIAQAPSVIIKYVELSQAKAPVPTASATTTTSTAGPTGSHLSFPTILTVALIFLVLGALIGRYAWRIK